MFDWIEDPELKQKAIDEYNAGVQEEIKKALNGEEFQKLLDEKVSGLKTKNNELLAEKKKIAETLKNFDNIDPEKAREALKFLEENENARLIKEGKFEELIAKQTSQMKSDFEAKISELTKMLETEQAERTAYETKYKGKMVSDELQKAAIKAGVRPEALEDVLYRGSSVFSLGEDGTVEARDKDGNLVKRDDLILTPSLWVEELKDIAPHYWPNSEGSGASGGSSGGQSDLEVQMHNAAKKGDMVAYRKIRSKIKEKQAANK